MTVFHANGVSVAGLEMNEHGHGALAVRSPVVNDFLPVEEEAGTAIGVDAEAIVAIDGRNELAGPAHGKILCGNTRTGRNSVPLEIDDSLSAHQRWVAG